jgi:potassium/hydrogen antiporter
LSIIAGVISWRIGAPELLVFLALGMLAGDDHVLGIAYDDFGHGGEPSCGWDPSRLAVH